MTPFDQLKRHFPHLIPIPELRANVSIIQLALHYGYQFQIQKGKSRPVLSHAHYQDTIIIKHPTQPSQQLYQQAGNFTDAGTVIDFVRHRLTTVFARFNHPGQHQLTSVTQVLYDYLKVDPSISTTQQRFITSPETVSSYIFRVAEFDLRPIEPVNYLLERGISPSTWQAPEFIGKAWTQIAYFDKQAGCSVSFTTAQAQSQQVYRTFRNVAFPYYGSINDEVNGLEIRNRSFKQHAPGSNRSTGVFISNTPAKASRFYIMESVIDALSHCQLKYQKGNHSFEDVYFSTGGQLTPGQFDTIISIVDLLDKAPNWQLCLSFDNDLSGHRYDLQFVKQLTDSYFPLASVSANDEYITYRLPHQSQYNSLTAALLEQISEFNRQAVDSINSQSSSTNRRRTIAIDCTSLYSQICLPVDCPSIAFFTKQLLIITGLYQRILIHKPLGKDFNQDLLNA